MRTARLQRKHAARAEFSRKLNESQETERRRIAGEVHDSLGQDLLVVRNLLGRLSAQGRRSSSRAQDVKEITESVDHAIEEVSKIAFDLHPHMLDRLGLKKTLNAAIRRAGAASDIDIRCDIDDIDGCYSPEEQINIFRIIQEAVNNVVKHAGASKCMVTIRRLGQQCEITVSDNGKGFDAERVFVSPSVRGGYGLGNTEERVRFLHGTMQIRTAPGKGTTAIFFIPISKRPIGDGQ
jgi:signal transduction histidine kinase